MNHRISVALGVVFSAFSMVGCYAYAGPPVAYAEVSEAPVEVDIATYPQTQYEGRPVYLYRDRWYYRNGSRWSYYREEPPTLHRQRSYVRQAPPARREKARPRVQPAHENEYRR